LRKKQKSLHFPASDVLTLVSDALIATVNVGHGKMTPVLIADATNRADIRELVRVHNYLHPGDVECAWGGLENQKHIVLLSLRFIRPVETRAVIMFDIAEKGGVIDAIIQARGFYLQPGKPDDRLTNTMDNPRILIEVGDLGFESIWEKLWIDALTRQFSDMGRGRSSSKLAIQFINEWRKLDRFQIT